MTGFGRSYGALTVVNAVACGLGVALGVGLETTAEIDIKNTPGFSLEMNGVKSSPEFVKTVISEIAPDVNGAHVRTVSNIPISVGLKSSSACANAVLLSVCDALSLEMTPLELLKANARACIKAGVSITGALDDAAACLLGGVVFTDNNAGEIIERREPLPGLSAVIRVPERKILKSEFPTEKLRAKEKEARRFFSDALNKDIFKAMYENGKNTCEVLGLSPEVADRALELGALGAGMSGTGPSVGIIVETKKLDSFLDEFGKEGCIVTSLR